MEVRNVKDSNGTLLSEGDSVTIIKSLKVKGSSSDLKRGQMVKNIRFTSSDNEIEGKVDKVLLVLKTEFLKKC
jgi:protein PhnA